MTDLTTELTTEPASDVASDLAETPLHRRMDIFVSVEELKGSCFCFRKDLFKSSQNGHCLLIFNDPCFAEHIDVGDRSDDVNYQQSAITVVGGELPGPL